MWEDEDVDDSDVPEGGLKEATAVTMLARIFDTPTAQSMRGGSGCCEEVLQE